MNKKVSHPFGPQKDSIAHRETNEAEPVDLSSHKYLKMWQGPNHPGITGATGLG